MESDDITFANYYYITLNTYSSIHHLGTPFVSFSTAWLVNKARQECLFKSYTEIHNKIFSFSFDRSRQVNCLRIET